MMQTNTHSAAIKQPFLADSIQVKDISTATGKLIAADMRAVGLEEKT